MRLEEQRSTARLGVLEKIPNLSLDEACSKHPTRRCLSKGSGMLPLLAAKVGKSSWNLNLGQTALRGVLEKLQAIDNLSFNTEYSCATSRAFNVPKENLQRVLRNIYVHTGLCLTCLKTGGTMTMACKHAENAEAAGPLIAG